MFCGQCGKRIDEDGALFCPHCGAPTTPDAARASALAGQAAGAPGQAGAGAPPSFGSEDSMQQGFNGAAGQPAGAPPEAGSGKRVAVIVAVSVAAVAVVAAIAVFALVSTGVIGGATGSSAESPAPEAATTAPAADQVPVPDVEGMSEDDAIEAFSDAGFAEPSVTFENSSSVAKGMVISQTPAAGTQADPSAADAALVVSSGPKTVVKREYTVVSQPLSFHDAQDYCESQGGQLACVHSAEEYQQVLDAANASGLKVLWLGGVRHGNGRDAGAFDWLDGEGRTDQFSDWASGEPNNDGGNEGYLAMFNVSGEWDWYDTPSSFDGVYRENVRGFVMQKDVEVPVS